MVDLVGIVGHSGRDAPIADALMMYSELFLQQTCQLARGQCTSMYPGDWGAHAWVTRDGSEAYLTLPVYLSGSEGALFGGQCECTGRHG